MKKSPLLPLPLLFALGCSSGAQYERGAYTPRPPPAPTFNPTTDAPHTKGQPGHVGGRGVSRSPNKRYTQPSATPQMMAADGDERRTTALAIDAPPTEATPDGIEREEFVLCWQDIRKMMKEERDLLLSFSPQEVRCMRHRVLAHCGARQIEKRSKASGKSYDPTYEDFMASEAHKKACGSRDQFRTERTTGPANAMMNHGDHALDWRP